MPQVLTVHPRELRLEVALSAGRTLPDREATRASKQAPGRVSNFSAVLPAGQAVRQRRAPSNAHGVKASTANPFRSRYIISVSRVWQSNAGTLTRFRCHTGHVVSGASLFVDQAQDIDRALWYAARTLRDKARLGRQLADEARRRSTDAAAMHFEAKAQMSDAHADVLQRMIETNAEIGWSRDTSSLPPTPSRGRA